MPYTVALVLTGLALGILHLFTPPHLTKELLFSAFLPGLLFPDTDFRQSAVTSDPARFAKAVADGTYHYLFEVTRVVAFIHWVSPPPRQKEQGMRPTLCKIYQPLAVLASRPCK
ncbi:MAG TPA: hypothetical protein ENG78_06905 [Acidiferrobacteraceae bacterium]|nr:hypothetical protein [Acidiferrobacteraceae bacterium]HEX20529.1 hypothetical protein [Acidiferrobacteraceae bacterium]